MARVALTDDEALALSGATDTVNKAVYPTVGSYDYAATVLRLMQRTLELGGAIGSQFEVGQDDASAVSIYVGAGKTVIGGEYVSYVGEVIDLSGYGNDVVYVWLADDGGGDAEVVTGTEAADWPGTAHVRLAEVTIVDGAISGIVDWRGALLFAVS